jgi:hypothetical protein
MQFAGADGDIFFRKGGEAQDSRRRHQCGLKSCATCSEGKLTFFFWVTAVGMHLAVVRHVA